MSRRGSTLSVFGNPVLIGSVTVLILVVAVFLSYTANNGLPFVPTRELKVQIASGQELVKGNEVREGGFRIGAVSKMSPTPLPDGSTGALITVKLDKKAGAFPVDSTAVIRPRTALGLEYLDLRRGSSSEVIADGGMLPVTQTRQEPELDQVLSTFDQPTRVTSQINLKEFGDAFTGRGADLNVAIQQLPRTLKLLSPVTSNIADPRSQLPNFLTQLDTTAATLAPVSPALAHLFTTMADTFGAIDRSPPALRDTIARTPATLAVATSSLRTQLPFLTDTARLGHDLQGATRELRAALPIVNPAISTGTRVTRRTPGLYHDLQGVVGALRDLATAPTTNAALRGLTATVGTLQPQLRFLGPYVTVCDYWNYWWSYAGESQSAPTPLGYALRAQINLGDPTNPNNVGSEPANVPANGQLGVLTPEYKHFPIYGAAVDANGNADCATGQTGYIRRGAVDYPPNYNIHVDSHTPLGYRAGSTYKQVVGGQGQGRNTDHVPAGETFTREPGGLGVQVPDPSGGRGLAPPPVP